MRINSHAHIFNIHSVFTTETLEILLRRLGASSMPDYLREPIVTMLEKSLKSRQFDNREVLMKQLVEQFKLSEHFREFVDAFNESDRPVDVNLVLKGDVDGLRNEILEGFFHGVEQLIYRQNSDTASSNVWDYLEFVYIALSPDIDAVADRLMRQLDEEDATVALMMDITKGDGSDDDLFTKQTADTSRQILRYPGRIFPFFAVNPVRPDHFERMKQAIETQGFVGVKLYPSLGYSVTSDTMDKVLKYCNLNRTPVMQHCNHGGFKRSDGDVEFGNPAHWREILDENETLCVCFGHFGGDENMTAEGIDPASWTGEILAMMREFPGRVYADISFHTNTMNGGDEERNYFKNLKAILEDEATREQVLWGTDYFLVRSRSREASYWNYFEDKLSKKHFKLIAEQNTRRYLGIDAPANGGFQPNIVRYLDFIAEQSHRIEGRPSSWLLKTLKAHNPETKNMVTAFGNRWTGNNQAHLHTFLYLKATQFDDRLKAEVKFAGAGGMPLYKLAYWLRGEGSATLQNKRSISTAMSFHQYMIKNVLGFENGFDTDKTVQTLLKILDDGDRKTLADLAEAADNCYRFVNEDI